MLRKTRVLALGVGAVLAMVSNSADAGPGPVATAPNDTGAFWSPEGRYLAFNREPPWFKRTLGGVWIVPTGGGTPVHLGEGVARAWRPGRDELLVTRGGEDTQIVSADGRTVATVAGIFATWSPDGRDVAFLRGRDLMLADADGGRERVLGSGLEVRPNWDVAGPVWAPDGSEVVLSVHSGQGVNPFDDSSLIVFRTDGSGSRLLFRGPNQNVNPSWSPDGDNIVFESNAGDWHVLTIPAGGGPATTLGDGRLPQWSPDGSRIAFISQRARIPGGAYSYRFDLYVMTKEGAAIRKLADDVHPTLPPQWSRTGAQLAYSAGRECLRWGVYVQNSDGGGERRVSNGCHIDGTPKVDVLAGTDYLDLIRGFGGADTIHGRGGPDTIDRGSGDDRIFAGRQADVVRGGRGDDVIVGGPGNDVLIGGPGGDRIAAGLGADAVEARDGFRDVIDCGGGREADTARVDRRDVVRNCERVRFSR